MMMDAIVGSTSIDRLSGQRFSTEDLPKNDRLEWLKEVIGREYANVEITPPQKGELFNEMSIYPWQQLRLSTIRSHAISLERLSPEPSSDNQDCYFAVMLCSGNYKLEQAGREVFLKAGEMTFYDATRPHRISIPESFSKVLVSIPRSLLKQTIRNVDDLTATKISATSGLPAITTNFIRTTVQQLSSLKQSEFNSLSEQLLNMFTLTLSGTETAQLQSNTKHRRLLLTRVKQQIMTQLFDPDLDANVIASRIGISKRYLNNLFHEEETSLMGFVLDHRMAECRKQLLNILQQEKTISEIAFQAGFNNMSHFSRVFKSYFGHSPREYRQLYLNK
jgi:AraC-like DNA-binding protein/mannose-6-phosphate isomerase-like protein (cupin superfamily)